MPDGATGSVFTVRRPPEPYHRRSEFEGGGGLIRGAYYVLVQRAG